MQWNCSRRKKNRKSNQSKKSLELVESVEKTVRQRKGCRTAL
nr:MAG TPA: hypothetical protein [Caudoviricetes sp.]